MSGINELGITIRIADFPVVIPRRLSHPARSHLNTTEGNGG